jgi:hypothetical protein
VILPAALLDKHSCYLTFSNFFCSVLVRNSSSTSTCIKHVLLSGSSAEGSSTCTATATGSTQHLQMLLKPAAAKTTRAHLVGQDLLLLLELFQPLHQLVGDELLLCFDL